MDNFSHETTGMIDMKHKLTKRKMYLTNSIFLKRLNKDNQFIPRIKRRLHRRLRQRHRELTEKNKLNQKTKDTKKRTINSDYIETICLTSECTKQERRKKKQRKNYSVTRPLVRRVIKYQFIVKKRKGKKSWTRLYEIYGA